MARGGWNVDADVESPHRAQGYPKLQTLYMESCVCAYRLPGLSASKALYRRLYMPLPGFTLLVVHFFSFHPIIDVTKQNRTATMVASVSSSTGSAAKWSDAVFSKLDTRNQGYIEKTDLASALSATGESSSDDSAALDDMFSAIDGDSDGKVTKSELSDAMTKLSDQLNAQFDASRMQGGMPPGPPPGEASSSSSSEAGGMGAAGSTASTDYVAAADTDGNGTVSDAEQAVYDKKLASGEIDKNGKEIERHESSAGGAGEKDPLRELAKAMQQLKAYADGDGSAAATGNVGVSVEA
jgi:hypothetical protein